MTRPEEGQRAADAALPPSGATAQGDRLGGAVRDATAQAVVAVVLAGRGPDGSADPEEGPASAPTGGTGGSRRLIATAAEGLAPRDRALLLLSAEARRTGAELARAVGVPPGQIYMVLHRMRHRAWRSMAAAVLLATPAPPRCPALAAVRRDCDDDFTPLVRKRVARHLDGCQPCRAEARRRIATAMDDG